MTKTDSEVEELMVGCKVHYGCKSIKVGSRVFFSASWKREKCHHAIVEAIVTYIYDSECGLMIGLSIPKIGGNELVGICRSDNDWVLRIIEENLDAVMGFEWKTSEIPIETIWFSS